jgi:hypothetical protein
MAWYVWEQRELQFNASITGGDEAIKNESDAMYLWGIEDSNAHPDDGYSFDEEYYCAYSALLDKRKKRKPAHEEEE